MRCDGIMSEYQVIRRPLFYPSIANLWMDNARAARPPNGGFAPARFGGCGPPPLRPAGARLRRPRGPRLPGVSGGRGPCICGRRRRSARFARQAAFFRRRRPPLADTPRPPFRAPGITPVCAEHLRYARLLRVARPALAPCGRVPPLFCAAQGCGLARAARPLRAAAPAPRPDAKGRAKCRRKPAVARPLAPLPCALPCPLSAAGALFGCPCSRWARLCASLRGPVPPRGGCPRAPLPSGGRGRGSAASFSGSGPRRFFWMPVFGGFSPAPLPSPPPPLGAPGMRGAVPGACGPPLPFRQRHPRGARFVPISALRFLIVPGSQGQAEPAHRRALA
jgi:hypothetical protein